MRSSRDSYALVIYWFFGYSMLSYTFAFWELFLDIDKDQWYLSKCDYKYVLSPAYDMGRYIMLHETFAFNFYWVALRYNHH